MARIAVVGGGIAGLSAAWHLAGADDRHQVTLFEAGSYVGGHTHTVDVTLPDAAGQDVTHGVDTGFLVFNHRTYPNLLALFDTLQVPTAASDMSFSVQQRQAGLEWSGRSLNTVFAQRRNLARPRFWGMLREVLRFNRLATELAVAGSADALAQSIGDFLDAHHFSETFRAWYFLPMIGCIWSCPTVQMLHFPVSTLIRFCHNHGLLQIEDRPQWYTVQGGAREYVRRMLPRLSDVRLATPVWAVRRDRQLGGATVFTRHGSETFDVLVLACHSDQALAVLGPDASEAERAVLGAIRYHPNRAVLHTDASVLPRRRRAWAAWNYEAAGGADEASAVCLHYWLNQLQPLPFAQTVVVSLNPVTPPAAAQVLGEYAYAHPVFDLPALRAQRNVPQLQGVLDTWFCGAWTGYGFHEDGLRSALGVVDQVRQRLAAPAVARAA